MSESSQQLATEFVRRSRYGVLSTHSAAVPGYPFGSITPYVVTDRGDLAILISTIAQHTANIQADSRVSLTIFDPADAADPQAGPRLTWLADAVATPNEELPRVTDRYLRHFPAARSYDLTHDFSYYSLQPVRVRLIGGFGSIHWIEPGEMDLSNPLADAEEGVLDHMNADHADALALIIRAAGGPACQGVTMTGIDPAGMDLLLDDTPWRVAFPSPIADATDARKTLVALTHEARQRCAA